MSVVDRLLAGLLVSVLYCIGGALIGGATYGLYSITGSILGASVLTFIGLVAIIAFIASD